MASHAAASFQPEIGARSALIRTSGSEKSVCCGSDRRQSRPARAQLPRETLGEGALRLEIAAGTARATAGRPPPGDERRIGAGQQIDMDVVAHI